MAVITPTSVQKRITFLDPASGRKARQSQMKDRARSAIVCIAVDRLYRIFLTYVWAGRISPSALVDKCIEVNSLFNPDIFGIESNAQQYLFAELVERDAKRLGNKLPLYPLNQPSNIDKDDRIRNALQPVAREGRLIVMAGQTEFMSEWAAFPTGKTKDILDSLASAITLAPRPQPIKVKQNELAAVAEYLRGQNLPPSYVQKRISEISREMGVASVEY